MSTDNIASSVMQTLGGGSGIDIVKLARDLTDVEKLPAEEKITASQEAAEAKISALAVLKFNVQALVDQFNGLNDAAELATSSYDVRLNKSVSDRNGWFRIDGHIGHIRNHTGRSSTK